MKRLIPLMLLTASIFAQNEFDALRPFFGFSGAHSLENAIGQATVASGEIVPGVTGNPANLGLHRFSLIGSNFVSGDFTTVSDNTTHTGFGGVYTIMPIRVYRGSLVFGLGIQKETDFSGVYSETDFRSTEEGGLYATSVGASMEFSRHLYIGADLKYYRGQDKLLVEYPDETLYYNPTYSGFGATIGFLNRINPHLQIGGVLHLPTKLWVDDNFTYSDLADSDESYSDVWEYSTTRPMQFRIGAAANLRFMNVFYELEWTDWSNLKFASDTIYEEDFELPAEVGINQAIKQNFDTTMSHRVGAAVHLPVIPLHLYGGYQYLPVPYSGDYKDDVRQSYSMGFSLLLNQQFSLHGSWSNMFWEYQGDEENYSLVAFGISLHY